MKTNHQNVARAEYKRIPEHEWPKDGKHPKGKEPTAKIQRLYMAPMKHERHDEELEFTQKGTYIVEWASLMRDVAGLFMEGVGLVILGHFVSIVAVMMLAGIVVGAFGLHVKTKHVHKG